MLEKMLHVWTLHLLHLFTGLPSMAIPVGKWVGFVFFSFFFFVFFSVSGKVSPITPLLSGVFVRRVSRTYFGRISGGSRKV